MKSINTVADLLKAAIPEKYDEIGKFTIPHMGNLGSAFEGVTQYVSEIICAEIHQGFSVVQGQIAVGDYVIPGQIDRMIVYGDGKEIGIRSGVYQYDISQVIAVIESKKTLNKSSLREAIDQLGLIRQCGFFKKDYYTENGLALDVSLNSNFFIGGYDAEDVDFNLFKLNESFLLDKHLPLSIVYGHEGYKNVSSFASTYHDIVYNHESKYGNHWFLPTLTISGNDVIMKGGHYPFFSYNYEERSIIHSVTADWAFEALVFALWSKIRVDVVHDLNFDRIDPEKNPKSPVVGFSFRPVEGASGWHDPMTRLLSYRSQFKGLKR